MRKFALILASLMLALIAPHGFGQTPDLALKLSAKDPTLRMEAGATVLPFSDVLGQKWLQGRVWAGAGAAVGANNEITGSFAALFKIPNAGKGFWVETGPGFTGREGKKSEWDWIVQFGRAESPAAAFGVAYQPNLRSGGLFYSRRF